MTVPQEDENGRPLVDLGLVIETLNKVCRVSLAFNIPFSMNSWTLVFLKRFCSTAAMGNLSLS